VFSAATEPSTALTGLRQLTGVAAGSTPLRIINFRALNRAPR